MYKISIGSDHAGYAYKQEIIKYLSTKGYEIFDVGTNSEDSCHYPVFAEKAALLVKERKTDFGILICSSGEGVCITANKVKGVRCGIGYNDEVSALMRKHNNANMIAFSQKFMSLDDIKKRIDIFLSNEFEAGRHQIRVELISEIENKQ